LAICRNCPGARPRRAGTRENRPRPIPSAQRIAPGNATGKGFVVGKAWDKRAADVDAARARLARATERGLQSRARGLLSRRRREPGAHAPPIRAGGPKHRSATALQPALGSRGLQSAGYRAERAAALRRRRREPGAHAPPIRAGGPKHRSATAPTARARLARATERGLQSRARGLLSRRRREPGAHAPPIRAGGPKHRSATALQPALGSRGLQSAGYRAEPPSVGPHVPCRLFPADMGDRVHRHALAQSLFDTEAVRRR
jgi:hypothetical protein